MFSTIRVFAFLLLGLGLFAGPSLAAVHTVNQVGFTFVPNDITITVGDTVEWVWSNGSHTVTNGTDLADGNLANLFDQPLSSANTPVSFTFNQTGDVAYFCRPHLGLGMTGIVRVSGLSPAGEIPVQAGFGLQQNSPNPFNPQTTIVYKLPHPTQVDLRIFDLKGHLVRTLAQEWQNGPQRHEILWDGKDSHGRQVVSGIYMYRLRAGDFDQTKRMTLVQ